MFGLSVGSYFKFTFKYKCFKMKKKLYFPAIICIYRFVSKFMKQKYLGWSNQGRGTHVKAKAVKINGIDQYMYFNGWELWHTGWNLGTYVWGSIIFSWRNGKIEFLDFSNKVREDTNYSLYIFLKVHFQRAIGSFVFYGLECSVHLTRLI